MIFAALTAAVAASAQMPAPQPPTSPVPPAPPVIVAPAAAPEWSAKNAVYAEVLGNGLLYSINYERFIPQWNVGIRGGVSFFAYQVSRATGSGDLTLASLPIVGSYYWGPGAHRLQLGLGITFLYFAASTDSTGTKFEGAVDGFGVAATAVVGYRYLPRDGGFTFGAGFTPLLRTTKGLLPWGGLDAGYAF